MPPYIIVLSNHKSLLCHENRKYIRGGVNPDHADFDGRTALHLACCGGRLSAVHVLVNEFHAFLNPVDL